MTIQDRDRGTGLAAIGRWGQGFHKQGLFLLSTEGAGHGSLQYKPTAKQATMLNGAGLQRVRLAAVT